MAEKLTSKLVMVLLNIVVLLVMGFCGFVLTTLNDKIAAHGVMMVKIDKDMEQLTKAINGLDASGMRRDIYLEQMKTDIQELKEFAKESGLWIGR